MKAVILAGGLGTRISEETILKPKPLVEIGGKPILWHIMKLYSAHGINDFIICCGYKGYLIKEYFANYFLHMSNVTFDMKKNEVIVHEKNVEPWKVTLVDTGELTMTAGRIKRIAPYLNGEDFCLTYGDGVSDVDITKLIIFHRSHGCLATVTAVIPGSRFGSLDIKGTKVVQFIEKPNDDKSLINGGFFVFKYEIISLIAGDLISLEKEPLEYLASTGQLRAHIHQGFWCPMDTLRDKLHLEELWKTGKAPWKVW
jgi:glucose-1-phosphate cytidylyltransferase